ncbi:ATP-binding cassette domain-containing protein [Salipiger sp. PrR007]|uniref:ATP-binding cassette domain-containing protein n=1 Tax=Salipiger sp. PrR007 TaxID=2706884 RepID=UPI0013B86504|nr:ATP-binding cassette domain-containing protein [Salipiger sp. PrR007]NDW33068.1 ATP-binding cassette domain-containing protein [Salipiger sp. PrR007]
MSEDVILKAEGLGVSFGGVHAVKAVDFALRAGELRCLIGPNGAGKTTFFRLLSGQYKPTRGTVTFRGKELKSLLPYQVARLGIGIKTQVPSLFEGMTVAENLALSVDRKARHAETRARVDEVLERIGLADLRDRSCAELAHGQRQWVELGQILASRPAVALLDEPAAGMTHSESVKTVEIIREITQHSAVIVVEHDMDFIRMIGERVTVFEQGEVIAEGSFQKVAKDPQVRAAYLGRKETADA